MTVKKKTVADPALRTWRDLNDAIRDASEADCERLLKLEKAGRKRQQFVMRIFSRLNRVRADRERQDLLGL